MFIIEFYRDTLSGATYWITAIISVVLIMALIGYNLERLGIASLPEKQPKPQKEKKPKKDKNKEFNISPVAQTMPTVQNNNTQENSAPAAKQVYDFSAPSSSEDIFKNPKMPQVPTNNENQKVPEILELSSGKK